MAALQVIRDFVCTACGCACDDLTVETDGSRIVAFAPPCPLAASFLLAERAEESGSSGRGKGMRSMTTRMQEEPGTSTPCHSDTVPSSVEVGSSANRCTN